MIFNEWKIKIVKKYADILSTYRAKKIFPENISLNLNELLISPREIRVAIIDDQNFPWKEALENRGCKVTYFQDYIKPISQRNQKNKSHDFSSFDIVICDIHGIGTSVYPGIEGLGVMEELRNKNPLQVIAAYTGNPGYIFSRMKKQDLLLDKVLSRDWEVDDFLLNFEDLKLIFTKPKNRWSFIYKRLKYLEVNERTIEDIRFKFVKNILISQILNKKFNFTISETKKLFYCKSNDIDFIELTKHGLTVAKVLSLVSPFILGDN